MSKPIVVSQQNNLGESMTSRLLVMLVGFKRKECHTYQKTHYKKHADFVNTQTNI